MCLWAEDPEFASSSWLPQDAYKVHHLRDFTEKENALWVSAFSRCTHQCAFFSKGFPDAYEGMDGQEKQKKKCRTFMSFSVKPNWENHSFHQQSLP